MAGNAEIDEVFARNVNAVFRAHQSAFKANESRLHQNNQHRAQHEPENIKIFAKTFGQERPR
jgi:GTPase SAR1 family protein